MRKIIFRMEVGFCGMDGVDNATFPDDVTDEELNEEAHFRAIQHAENYGYYPSDEYEGTEDEDDDGGDRYVDSIEGWWEDYNPDEHDGLKAGGGEWEWGDA